MSTATTHIETEKQLVPELRFNEFEGEWENNRLHDMTNLITKGTTPKTFTSSGVNYVKIEGLVGVNINKDKCVYIDEEVHLKELKRSILQENDLLFAIAGATVGKVGIVTSDILPANTNQALAIIRLKNKEYLNYILQILQSRVMKKYIYQSVSVGAQPNLNLEQIGDFRFNLPTLPEQQKIASFLSAVDEKIQQLTKKKALLEQYKKGVMQQLFSGQLRFKDENGNSYPDWKDRNLNHYLKVSKAKNEDLKYDKNDVLSVSGEFGIVNQIEFQGRSFAGASVHNYGLVENGNIVYTKSPLKSNPYGIIKVNKDKAGIVSTLYAVYKCKPTLIGAYLDYYFQLDDNTNRYLRPLVQKGSKNDMKINNEKVLIDPIMIPSTIEEQQKVVDYLEELDSKIVIANNQITQTQNFKKGLLQQMFV
tara:strand:- start:1486 stop:2748 length:1263 start_codon:yes stop_codon:yes gene_type:complete